MSEEIVQEETVETPEETTEAVEEESTEEQIDWEARARKAEATIQKAKKKPKPKLQEPTDLSEDVMADIAALKLSEKKRQFGYEHGLSPEETDRVFKVDPAPNADTLKDPFVKAGLSAVRKQRELKDNIPSSSSKKAKPFEQKEFKEKTPQEKQKEYQTYMKSKYGRS